MNNFKRVPISISSDYVAHWGVWEAIRELLQNAIDTKDYSVEEEDCNLTITSRGGKIPIKALLLGNSGKRDDDSAIGTYGEGLKLAMVVLLRNNKGITIKNGNDLWTPIFEYSELFEGESLSVVIEENVFPSEEDVVVTVSGLNWSDLEEFDKNYIDLPSLVQGEIGAESSRGIALYRKYETDGEVEEAELSDRLDSRVFVNGLYVGTVPGKYFYNYSFRPEYLNLDRDRNTVPRWEFQYETTRLLASSNHPAEIARLSVSDYNDVANYTKSGGSYYSGGVSTEKSEAITKFATDGFIETYGADAFPINDNWSIGKKTLVTQKVVLAGKVPVNVSNSLYEMISKNYQVEDKLEEMLKFDPIKYLSGFLDRFNDTLPEKAKSELEETVLTLKIAKGD